MFVNENGETLPYLEVVEQFLVSQYIEPNDHVLELGARYGMVSVGINKLLADPTKQVVVEPDDRVIGALHENRDYHDCKFGIWYGFVSETPLSLTRTDHVCQGDPYLKGYGSTFVKEDSSIPISDIYCLEKRFNVSFNTLVADCEGYLEEFFLQNTNLFKRLDKVIFEEDYPDKCDYQWIKNQLVSHGFQCEAHVTCKTPTKKIKHFVYIKE